MGLETLVLIVEIVVALKSKAHQAVIMEKALISMAEIIAEQELVQMEELATEI